MKSKMKTKTKKRFLAFTLIFAMMFSVGIPIVSADDPAEPTIVNSQCKDLSSQYIANYSSVELSDWSPLASQDPYFDHFGGDLRHFSSKIDDGLSASVSYLTFTAGNDELIDSFSIRIYMSLNNPNTINFTFSSSDSATGTFTPLTPNVTITPNPGNPSQPWILNNWQEVTLTVNHVNAEFVRVNFPDIPKGDTWMALLQEFGFVTVVEQEETPFELETKTHESDASSMTHPNIYSYNNLSAGHWNQDPNYNECFGPVSNYNASNESRMILYPGTAYPDHKITKLVFYAVKHPTFDIDFTFEVSDSPTGPWESFTHYTKSARDLGGAWARGIYTITGVNAKYIRITWPKNFGDSWECLGSAFTLTTTNDPDLPQPFGRASGDCTKLVERNIAGSGNLVVADSPESGKCFQPATSSNGTGNTYIIFAAPEGSKVTKLRFNGLGTEGDFPDFAFSVSNVLDDDEFLTFAGSMSVTPVVGNEYNKKVFEANGLNSRYVKVTWPYQYGSEAAMVMSDYYFEYTDGTVLAPIVIPKEPPAYPAVYNINLTGQLQQTVTDWGVFYGATSANDNRNLLKTAVFTDMGITNFRIELSHDCGGPNKTINYSALDRVGNTIRTARDYGVDKYLLSVWSPPPEFKTNGSHLGSNQASLKVENEQDYCDYIVKCLDYITKNLELPKPYAFDLQNEPENDADYQACYYTPAQYIRVTKMMRNTLDAAGYSDVPLIGIGDVFLRNIKYFGNNFSQFANDQELNDALAIVAVHSYVHPGWTGDNDVRNWRTALDLYPEKQAWMTEFCTGAGLPTATMLTRTTDLAKVLSANMVHARINNWIWWLSHSTGYEINVPAQETLLSGNGTTVLNKSMQYHLLSLIYNNAFAGSKVALLETDDPEIKTAMGERIDMCAWRNNSHDVVLLANTKKSTERYYKFNNLNGISATVYYFDEEISMYGGSYSPNNFEPKVLPTKNLTDGSIVVEVPNNTVVVVITSQDTAPPEASIDNTPEVSYLWYSDKYISRTESFDLIIDTDIAADILVNGDPAVEIGERKYSIPVTLVPGENIFTISVTDAVTGISGNKVVTIVYTPDFVNVEITSAPRAVNYTNYTLEGKMNTAGTVYINDVPVAVDPINYSFTYSMTLEQGRNKIKIIGVDERNNQSTDVLVFVECDSLAPVITIDAYNAVNNDGEFVISGSVSKEVTLTINGVETEFISDQNFANKFQLNEGVNSFVIYAIDSFFNEAQQIVTVVFEPNADTPTVKDSVIYSKKATDAVVIDGILSEADWKIENKITKTLMGTPNNIVNSGTTWDENYLYVGFKVVDSGLFFDDGQVYNNDGLEIFVNGDGQRGGNYNSFDHQLFIGYINNTTLFNNNKGVLTAWNNTDDGYTAEIAIPWSIMGVEPGVGVTIGFDIDNVDKDKTGSRSAIVAWKGTGDNWNNTSAYGLLTLRDNTEPVKAKPQAIQSFYVIPSEVVGTDTDGEITFTWIDPNNADSAVGSYELYLTNGGNKWLDTPVIIDAANTTVEDGVTSATISFAELGITKTGEYDFRIKATNVKGAASFVYLGGANRYKVSVTVEVLEPTAKPKVITNFEAVLNGEEITFTWINPNPEKSISSIASYSLYKTSGGSVWLEEAITIDASEVTVDEGITSVTLSLEALGIVKSGNYDFRIKANNGVGSASYVYIGGESRYKVAVSIESPVPVAKPKAITAFNAAANEDSITFTWVNPNNSATAVEYYELYRTNTGNTWQTPVNIDAASVIVDEGISSITLTFEELGIDKSGSYDFRIKGFNGEGTSALTYLGGGTSSDANRYRLDVVYTAPVVPVDEPEEEAA